MTKRSDVYIQLIYGWFNKSPIGQLGSRGLIILGRRLREMGYTLNDDIPWNRPDLLASALMQARVQNMKTAAIGFSLGANAVAEVSHYVRHEVELGVAYDPSQWYKGRMTVAPLMKRCLVYRAGWNLNPYGHAVLTGPTVESQTVNGVDHFRIPYREDLHALTFAALARLEAA